MSVKKIPGGMTAVTPHLVVAGAAQAIDWYKKAFGATEEMRSPVPTAASCTPASASTVRRSSSWTR